jgi:hypothetical protein
MDQVIFVIGIATPATIVLVVFGTLLLIQEKTAEAMHVAQATRASEPAAAAKEKDLDDQGAQHRSDRDPERP